MVLVWCWCVFLVCSTRVVFVCGAGVVVLLFGGGVVSVWWWYSCVVLLCNVGVWCWGEVLVCSAGDAILLCCVMLVCVCFWCV